MNDITAFIIIFVMVLIFFFTFMIIDTRSHKAEMRDISFKYKLERIDRQLDELIDVVRKK